MQPERRRRLYEAVDRATELPMLVLAVVFVALLVVPWVFAVSEGTEAVLEAISWIIWAASPPSW